MSVAVTMSATRGLAGGDRAGLVEQQDLAARELFERATALHDDAAASRPRQAGDDRDRRGEDERARCRDDEDRNGALEVTRQRPRRAGERQRDPEEHRGVAVGEPHERRARRLGFGDEPDDARVGALRRARRRPQVERPARVHDPASDRVSNRVVDGQRLTRQRALVEHRLVGLDESVDRDDLARLDEQQVAAPDVVDGGRRRERRCRSGAPREARAPAARAAHVGRVPRRVLRGCGRSPA